MYIYIIPNPRAYTCIIGAPLGPEKCKLSNGVLRSGHRDGAVSAKVYLEDPIRPPIKVHAHLPKKGRINSGNNPMISVYYIKIQAINYNVWLFIIHELCLNIVHPLIWNSRSEFDCGPALGAPKLKVRALCPDCVIVSILQICRCEESRA